MAWVKLDDRFFTNPKVMKAGRDARDLYLAGLAYCAAELTNGFVPNEALPHIAVTADVSLVSRFAELAERLASVGLWEREGDAGYYVHDYLRYNPTAEVVRRERDAAQIRKQLYADPFAVQRIKERDADLCRYCGVKVSWHDRRGPIGGTLDHVIPIYSARTSSGTSSYLNEETNVVVACRRCNSKKGGRTPEEAGMVLLAPGTTQVGTRSAQSENQVGTRSDLSHIPSPSVALSPPEREARAGATPPTHDDQANVHAVPKPERREVERHPACKVYRQLTGKVLNAATRGVICDAIPADADEEALNRWGHAITEWVGRGYKRENITGMLDWWRDGVPEKPRRDQSGGGIQRNGVYVQPAAFVKGPPPPEHTMTAEELEASDAERARIAAELRSRGLAGRARQIGQVPT